MIGWILLGTPLYAQDFQLSEIRPRLSHDTLTVEISCHNLFENQIRKTLLAGLPLVMDFSLRLMNTQRQAVVIRSEQAGLTYDVWEEIFRVSGMEKMPVQFQTLEQLIKRFSDLPPIVLAPVSQLSSDDSYQVQVELKVVLLSQKQSRQLKDWLESSETTEEDLPSQDRSTGFRLNLNRMVQMFFSGEKKPDEYSASAISKKFKIRDLNRP